jgi:hypothetical protein
MLTHYPKFTILWLTLFGIAMGYLESAVVVYLREIYYPGGFGFPLVSMSEKMALTEVLREAATVIMLLATGYMAGHTFSHRFAWFIYCFAVWDIFYYVFLKALLHWPASWLTWDLLFLIPVPWTGPVIAPVIVSCTMILLAAAIVIHPGEKAGISPKVWLFMIAGSALIFLSFIWDFSDFVLNPARQSFLQADSVQESLKQYMPEKFNWPVFTVGELLLLSGLIVYWRLKKPVRHAELL